MNIVNNCLVYLRTDSKNVLNKEFFIYDMNAGTEEKADIDKAWNYAPYRDSLIIVAVGDIISGMNLVVYDIEKSEIVEKKPGYTGLYRRHVIQCVE